MHKDFIQSHSQEKVSYESYRKILNSMNISFTKLGGVQCELCEEHTRHQCQGKRDSNEQEGENNNCEICKRIEIQLERARKSRKSYRADANNNGRYTEPCFSMDMQKGNGNGMLGNASPPSWYEDGTIYQTDSNDKSKPRTIW